MNEELYKVLEGERPLTCCETMEGFEIQNLDCFTINPVELAYLARVYELYGQYARLKAMAIQHRLDGEINEALREEHNCDVLYNDLPKWAKW